MIDQDRLFSDDDEAVAVPPPVVRDVRVDSSFGQRVGSIDAHVYADGVLGHEDTETSLGAAIAERGLAKGDAQRVYRLIVEHGGLTDDEGEQLLGLRHTTYSARRRGLVLDGFVIDSGTKRLTSAQRPATVWCAANG